MAGRIPKPKAQRARANKTMGEKLTKEQGGIAPELGKDHGLCEYAVAYWHAIWESPMGIVYLDADIPALLRLTELVHLWHIAKEPSVLQEIRQLEDRFGLSPLSRRRLEWEIVSAGGEPEQKEADTGEDERWLRVV